jgi:predicted TIM-barrel fold metal-dependent hydrolase
LWASDYPHTDTTWPFSHDVVDREFADAAVPPDERRAITVDNCARLYAIPT